MYRSKKDVDKHVESLISKLSVKEFKTRAYSVARLYFEVGDYESCQKYVEQYLTQKDTNAAAYKLLGQALQKLGQKEKALEYYKTSLEIDPSQTSVILDICDLLAADEVTIDPGRAKYWCEKAEATFPRHPITFRLRERLLAMANSDPEALTSLLKAELAVRPKDAQLHVRLLRHYMLTNQTKEAFDHSCEVEFGGSTFRNNFVWYETVSEILKNKISNSNDWLHQLLLLTVKERICVLSLTETPSGLPKSLSESSELLHDYDQAIGTVARDGAPPGFGEFHASLLRHHQGQFVFHAATLLLKRAKKGQLNWHDATRFAAPLMLIAWQTVPLDSKVNWLTHAPEKLQISVQRWYTEGAYRCSQSGHYLLSNIQDKSQSFLDRIAQCCSGSHWRDKLFEKLFTSRDHLAKIKTSHFASNAYGSPERRLPRKVEVEAYDGDAQKEYPNSLHHFVWILSNYKNYAHFKCTIFESLKPTATNYGPETLSKLDVDAFLYCAALTMRQHKSNDVSYLSPDKPNVLPANITVLLCSSSQMKWWDCTYKFSQNELGTELTDIRATLSRGIEVVRCIDNHGLDPELLCSLGKIFSERGKLTTTVEEKTNLEIRAGLYYTSAIPLLEKLKRKITIKIPEKRMFDYTHKELNMKDLNSLIEESKLYVAVNFINDCEYEKAIEMLSDLKSPQAYFQLGKAYKNVALEKNVSKVNIDTDTKSKYALLSKAKTFAYKSLDKIKDAEINKSDPLYSEIQQLIEEIEVHLGRMDTDLSGIVADEDGKYSSDDISGVSEHVPSRNHYHVVRNISSTPNKQPSHLNITNYSTAVSSQILETTRVDEHILERSVLSNQIKSLQKKLSEDMIELSKSLFEESRRQESEIMSKMNDQFKLLKISVNQVKDQMDECRNKCEDVSDLKKQLSELKKEISKLKKASSEQTINESDLYNLDDDYRTNDTASTFAAQLPFQAPPVMPQFNQRLVPPFPVPPNPYQLYSQSLYNLYNQYSQFAQSPAVPGAPPLFDPTRAPVNYPGVYPTPDQMYLDVAHLVPPGVPPAPTVPVVPTVSAAPTLPAVSTVPTVCLPSSTASVTVPKPAPALDSKKEVPRSLPVNVVITSSDPLPTCTTTPTPILSVTIPPKHIKGTPHNYQIQMPSTNETKMMSPPVFSFPSSVSKTPSITSASSMTNWPQTTFKTTQTSMTATGDSLFYSSKVSDSFDNSKTWVDGVIGGSQNNSLNKSRTLSEKSNTSVDNYDPCPDFKPIIPLPAEVKVKTGEEDEAVIFSARAKLFRFVDKQWKERGIGEMKLLKHKTTGKVRVLMRREQIHKICANHIITSEMEIKPMKNETKAYFWVANDFADETVVLEKFCIRFKTADIAQQFYEAFEAARLEFNNSSAQANVNLNEANTTASQVSTTKNVIGLSSNAHQSKTEFGGFTFSSTPTFKTVSETNQTEPKSSESTTGKVNVFSGLSFKSTNSSPFSNIFTTTASSNQFNTSTSSFSTSPIGKQETTNKLNSSDIVEEYEPNVEFKPVVPLPALIDQKTGEEDETVLFEHRAKLLRFDASNKEWKERGLGQIKLLVHKENVQKLRLLMRREQIMKVCCNHAITKDMVFKKMPNMDKAVTWCAKDFSEGELVAETFCLRFKNVQACEDFMEALKTAQSKLKDDSKAAKEEQNAAKQNTQTGFGDQFKSKPGSWHCDTCYTNNLESFAHCACCEQPKPQKDTNTTNAAVANWGDKFKPKAGSWECNSCLVRNEASIQYCSACNNSKDPNTARNEIKLISDNAPKFSFGIPTQTSITVQKNIIFPSSRTITPGWGDQFKPKEGTWQCEQCFIRNESNIDKCAACASPKDPNANKNETNSTFINVTSGPKFSFGIPPTSAEAQKPNTESTSIFDGTGAHKFSFGILSNAKDKTSNITLFSELKPSIFGTPKVSTGNEGSTSSIKTDDEIKPTAPAKPALLPTPQPETPLGKETGTFDFVFKPKTTPKGKSPIKSPKGQKGDESDGEAYVSEDEGHHIHFSPVIPMPDKVNVVTGEENETEFYGHRAKLYRFTSGEWKERGIGVVKILKHKDTDKLRVVMRREQVLKICLNHALTPEITYTAKDDKTWLFAANDYSEGELSLQQFCLRFKNKEIALEFKDAIDRARQGNSATAKKDSDSDDVVFVDEIHTTTEEKQKAKDLMLPENFYNYKHKVPCQGCRGCRDENDGQPDSLAITKPSVFLKAPAIIADNFASASVKHSTPKFLSPVKPSTPTFQSPMNSFYGTPSNFDKTLDTTIFRTPLGSHSSNSNSSNTTPNKTLTENDTTNKENTFIKNNNFGIDGQPSIFAAGQSKLANNSSVDETQASSKGVILAAPKLSALNTSGGEQQTEPSSIFGATQSKSLFGESKSVFGNSNSGISSNKSIFAVSADNENDQKDEVKSIFGAEDKPVNLFSSAVQGSIFGPGVLANNQQKTAANIFGSSAKTGFGAPQTQTSDGGASIFSSAAKQAPAWATGKQDKPDVTATNVSNDKKIDEVKPANDLTTKETLFNVDNTLTFAALSSSAPGFNIQKKTDFQWEGAGQQLFGQKAFSKEAGDKSKNDSGAGDDDETGTGAEEEYDPHYEPIVPLPEKIVVTTGEEDEEKLFGERCKLYRYDDKSREWKERGVGEMKVLYHPERKTYRLLLRREQVHKAVLNMLLFMDLELLPMKNSDRAWTWAGRNFAENPAGEQETLAVRFKSVDLATNFLNKVVECVRKLQASAAQVIKEEKETYAPLRLPKHLDESARADFSRTEQVAQSANQSQDSTEKQNGEMSKPSAAEVFKQVHFREPEEEVGDDDEEEYEHDYEHSEDYDAYYNDDEEEPALFSCDGEAVVRQGDAQTTCEHSQIQVLYDQDICSPKIVVTDANTGEILADMLIYTETDFHMNGDTCTWSGTDYTSNERVDKTVTINFYDSDTAIQFYDCCETSKASTYSSTDPES